MKSFLFILLISLILSKPIKEDLGNGIYYIGVNDDGSIYGVKDIDHVQRQVADRILNNIKPNAIGLFG